MHIKIYFNDKPLFLADKLDDETEPYIHHDDAILIDELSAPSVNSMIHEMRQASIHAGIFIHKDFEALKHAFFKKFKIVKAAGGLVLNNHKEMLFIFRRGKWDFPKENLTRGKRLKNVRYGKFMRKQELRQRSRNHWRSPIILTTRMESIS